MSGAVTEAMSILSAALSFEDYSFLKKPEFSREVVSYKVFAYWNIINIFLFLLSCSKCTNLSKKGIDNLQVMLSVFELLIYRNT